MEKQENGKINGWGDNAASMRQWGKKHVKP